MYMYIYLRQLDSHKWQNLIGLENLKIPGFHFYGTMKLFTKVVWLYFVKVLVAFPISRHAHAPCAHPRARLSRDFIFSNFCGRNFVSREVTQRPRVKTKNRWFAGSWLSFSNFQVSPQYLFCQTMILDQLKLLQLTSIFHLNAWIAECFVRKILTKPVQLLS